MFRASLIAAAAALFASQAMLALEARSHEYRQGGLTISHPWARPTPGESKLGAAYMTVQNAGNADDKLTAGKADVAERVEIHEHAHGADGVMRMREVEGGLAVPAGGKVEMKPGGYHIMLIGLKQKLEDGQSFPLTLTFKEAGELTVEVKVEKSPSHDAKDHGQAHSHHHKH